MPFIWPSVVVLPFFAVRQGASRGRQQPSAAWQGHMIAVLLQAASACTPGFPHNKRALVLLCAEESIALLMGRLHNSFSSVISPVSSHRSWPRRAPRPGASRRRTAPRAGYREHHEFAVEIAVGLRRDPIVFLGIGKAG
jgi:hypothetical protein